MLAAWIAFLLWAPCSQGVSTNCEILAVEELQSTSLTCNFSEDISKLQQDFKVLFYKNDSSESPDIILDCHWDLTKTKCNVHKCCTYDGRVSDSLTVHVPMVTQDSVGRYVCFVLPSLSESFQFCNFTVKERQMQKDDNSLVALAALAVIPVFIICFIMLCMVKCRGESGNSTKWITCLSSFKRTSSTKGKSNNGGDQTLLNEGVEDLKHDQNSEEPANPDLSSKKEQKQDTLHRKYNIALKELIIKQNLAKSVPPKENTSTEDLQSERVGQPLT